MKAFILRVAARERERERAYVRSSGIVESLILLHHAPGRCATDRFWGEK